MTRERQRKKRVEESRRRRFKREEEEKKGQRREKKRGEQKRRQKKVGTWNRRRRGDKRHTAMDFIQIPPRSYILDGTLHFVSSFTCWSLPRASQSRSEQVLVANAQQCEPRVLAVCVCLERHQAKTMALWLFSPRPRTSRCVALLRGDQILVAYAEPSARAG